MPATAVHLSKLVRTSLRMRATLLLALSTTLVMSGFCLWALHGLINQAEADVRLQFTNLSNDLLDQERFLEEVAAADRSHMRLPAQTAPLRQESVDGHVHLVYHEEPDEHVGPAFEIRSKGPSRQAEKDAINAAVPLARSMARRYVHAFGGRPEPGSEAFLIDLDGFIEVSISCKNLPGVDATALTCRRTLDEVRQHLANEPSRGANESPLRWTQLRIPDAQHPATGIVLYRSMEVRDATWPNESTARRLVIGTLLQIPSESTAALEQGHKAIRSLSRRTFNGRAASISDHQPQGRPLDHSSHSLRSDGLHVYMTSAGGWQGVYSIPWSDLFRAASWQIAVLLCLVVLCAGGSLALYRRHRSKVVLPAQASHNAIAENEFFSRTLIDISRVAFAVLGIDDERIVVRNALAEQWLGGEEAIQRLLLGYVASSENDDAASMGIDQLLVVGERHLSARYGRTLYQGRDVLLAAFSDVTMEQQAKHAMAAAKKAADDASAGKTVLLATMSHEIRTPLYGILGTIELLGLTRLTAQQRGYLDTVQTSSAGLLNIISDILDVSRIESRQVSLKASDFDPLQLTEEVVRTYAANADRKGLQLYAVVAAGVPTQMRGDQFRIKQVLNNLLSNAIKFTEAGWVRVVLDIEPSKGEEVVLSWKVSDTGVGVSQAQAQSLFQPFYQVQGAPNTVPGAGLGLYICHSLCEMMKGSLQVESSPGRGSTFNVVLPLVQVAMGEGGGIPTILGEGTVWVRAPIRELATNIGDWLVCAGANVRIADPLPEVQGGGAVLVELFADRMAPVEWNGPRVSCTLAGPELPQWGISGVQVSAYSLRGILQAVTLARVETLGVNGPAGHAAGHTLARLHAAPQPPGEEPYKPAVGLDRLGLRVLVAEDNVVNRALLAKQLEELGCSVSTSADGLEALDRWNAESFDVLLTDMNMPNMDGYELVRTLRARGTTSPIIGITASVMQSERQLGMALGLDAWITKPIDLSALYDILRNACAGGLVSPTSQSSLSSWSDDLEFSEHLMATFRDSILEDSQQACNALAERDPGMLTSALHRMRGALAVMKFEELATFNHVLEARISVEGLTPALENAARSLLREIEPLANGLHR